MEMQLVETMTGRLARSARAIIAAKKKLREEFSAEEADRREAELLGDVQYMVRSMNDLFKDIQKTEAEWRRAVYAGETLYTHEDDASLLNCYRDWLKAVRVIIKAIRALELRVRGLGALKARIVELNRSFKTRPSRLIDHPRVGLVGDPAKLDIRPLADILADHPEQAERVQAAQVRAAAGEGLVPLSDYLIDRGTR